MKGHKSLRTLAWNSSGLSSARDRNLWCSNIKPSDVLFLLYLSFKDRWHQMALHKLNECSQYSNCTEIMNKKNIFYVYKRISENVFCVLRDKERTCSNNNNGAISANASKNIQSSHCLKWLWLQLFNTRAQAWLWSVTCTRFIITKTVLPKGTEWFCLLLQTLLNMYYSDLTHTGSSVQRRKYAVLLLQSNLLHNITCSVCCAVLYCNVWELQEITGNVKLSVVFQDVACRHTSILKWKNIPQTFLFFCNWNWMEWG